MTALDVSSGHSRHPWRGAGIGFLAGAAFGTVAGVISCSDGGCTEGGAGYWTAVSAGFFAASGAVVGAVIGALVKTERWEEVPLDQLRVSFVPLGEGRFALGLSVEF